MAIVVGDLVTLASPGSATILFQPVPELGKVNANPQGPPETFEVLWANGRITSGLAATSLMKIQAAAQAVSDATPLGRPLRVIGDLDGLLTQPAQENLFMPVQAINGEDDAGNAEVFIIVVPIRRDRIDVHDRFAINVGASGGAIAEIQTRFGTPENGFQGSMFKALPGHQSPRY